MANELQDALSGMGFSFADTPEEFETNNAEETPATEEQPQDEVVETAEETVTEEAPTQEAETQESESSLQEENIEPSEVTNEEYTEEVNDTFDNTQVEELSDDALLSALNERFGVEVNSFEEFQSLLDKEEQTTPELDPQVKAIADFVSETGRTVDDWFAYQSFNPSEMDDKTVMMNQLKAQMPDLSDEDAQLLLDNKYKLDSDMYTENEAKVGALQLKMDAQAARKELEAVREQYKAPTVEQPQAAAEEIESPITEDWINAMSTTVDEIESLEIELGKDKTFSFGLDDSYKATLKSKNAKLDEFFDPYVDGNGNWDFDSLSAHRAIIDNIDSIAKAIYAQGLSDGQSEVVKQTVNPSAPNPSGGAVDAPSAQDKVRQQVLDALRGGDDKMRFKF